MSSKVTQFIITTLIVLILAGMLAGSGSTDDKVVNNTGIFESIPVYDTGGYSSIDPFVNDDNFLSNINEKISVLITDLTNEGIEFIFKLIKKLVS